LAVAGLAVLALLPVTASAQTLPGTTVGEACTTYKEINQPPEYITYYQCRGGSTVKFIQYRAESGELFTYVEFRDQYGQLTESRFSRAPNLSASDIPLGDSVSP
jgi:hypothetical protein